VFLSDGTVHKEERNISGHKSQCLMLCSVPTHVSDKCQEVGLNMFKHNFYVSKGKKSERGNKGCKITIAHEVSILEFRIKDYT